MDEINEVMLTKKRFRVMVEETVRDMGLSYLDAILYICETNNIEPEDVKKYMSPVIKDKLEVDAMKLNFLAGGNDYLPLE